MGFNRTSFSFYQLVKQTINDLYSKEVITGYNTTYVWLANQLGHVALGFIPTIGFITLYSYFFSLNVFLSLFCLLPIAYIIYKEQKDIENEKIYYKNTSWKIWKRKIKVKT